MNDLGAFQIIAQQQAGAALVVLAFFLVAFIPYF